MAGGDSIGCAARKKSKNKTSDEYSLNGNKGGENTKNNDPPPVRTTRGGLRVYKIVILGDGGVGKSAVTLQFVSHSFLDYHDPTIGEYRFLCIHNQYVV